MRGCLILLRYTVGMVQSALLLGGCVGLMVDPGLLFYCALGFIGLCAFQVVVALAIGVE